MFRKTKPLFLICESPLHVGTGTDLGIVDNPIQRERHTSFPKIEGSGLKGAIREVFEQKLGRSSNEVSTLFGRENSSENAGSVGLSDARILLFPVKSAKGVFAWITCPMILQQMEIDFNLPGSDSSFSSKGSFNLDINDNLAVIVNEEKSKITLNEHVILEEYAFLVEGYEMKIDDILLNEWLAEKIFPSTDSFFHDKLKSSLVILSDDNFTDFVNLSTEVTTGIRIDHETGVVKDGALFTQEYLPSESILYTNTLFSPEFTKDNERKNENDIEKLFCKNLPDIIQIGGNSSIGKGITRTQFLNPLKTVSNGK